MKIGYLDSYFRKLNQLKEDYKDEIEVLIGLEIDYIPGLTSPKSMYLQKRNLDFTIGSVHFNGQFKNGRYWDFEDNKKEISKGVSEIFNNDIELLVRTYYQNIRDMITKFPPTIIGHLDRIKNINRGEIYFTEKENWYIEEIEKTLETITNTDCILEINSKGMYRKGDKEPYPSNWIIQKAFEKNIPIHFSSDAHNSKYLVQKFDELEKIVQKIGYQTVKKILV